MDLHVKFGTISTRLDICFDVSGQGGRSLILFNSSQNDGQEDHHNRNTDTRRSNGKSSLVARLNISTVVRVGDSQNFSIGAMSRGDITGLQISQPLVLCMYFDWTTTDQSRNLREIVNLVLHSWSWFLSWASRDDNCLEARNSELRQII